METFTISGFKGLNQILIRGTDRTQTRTLDGVRLRHGKVFSQGGITKLRGITTASATTPIIALMRYEGTDQATTVLRMTPTKVHKLNTSGNSWDDATGTDLTGISSTRPQWTGHKGVLVFTNEGKDRPRKWTGSGNTTVLGGTPPYAKAIADYEKFLMLGNISSDGTTFNPRRIAYSDDYDVNWSSCTGFEINLDETDGEIRAMLPLGKVLIVYKADAVQPVRFVGGNTRFTHDVFPFDQGILAPRSLQMVGNAAHAFLATDLQLYRVSTDGIKALPPFVIDQLQSTMDVSKATAATSAVAADVDSYHLLYPVATSDTYKRGRISYNFRTGEFFHRTYAGHEFLDIMAFKYAPNEAEHVIASASDLVYEIDHTTVDDDGTAVSRYIDTDWQDFENDEEKYLRAVQLRFKRSPGVRVKISLALDDLETFRYEKVYDLKGRSGEETTRIEYNPPQDLTGRSFNVRIRFFHDVAGAVGELRSIDFKWEPAPGTRLARLHEVRD